MSGKDTVIYFETDDCSYWLKQMMAINIMAQTDRLYPE